MKKIVPWNTVLSYADFNKWFHIHIYASNLKLETVISQEVKPIYFYRRKLTKKSGNRKGNTRNFWNYEIFLICITS